MLTRRKLLDRSIGLALLTPSLGWLSACSQEPEPVQDEPEIPTPEIVIPETLGEYAAQMNAIEYIGPTCRTALGGPESVDPAVIESQLTTELQAHLDAGSPGSPLIEQIEHAIRQDFLAERSLVIDGWQLSVTECKLAILAAAAKGITEPESPGLAEIREGHFVDIADWGPMETLVGEPFNQQPDGHSGMWFTAPGAPASTVVVFEGKYQTTQVYDTHLTSGLRGQMMQDVIGAPGEYRVELYDRASRVLQHVGTFVVYESLPTGEDIDLDSCQIESWGPLRADQDRPFNEQPDGSSAFWVKTNCAAKGSALIFMGEELHTTVHENLLTALAPNGHKVPAGRHLLQMRPGASEELLDVGYLEVR